MARSTNKVINAAGVFILRLLWLIFCLKSSCGMYKKGVFECAQRLRGEALKNICRFSVLRLTDALYSSKMCGLIFGGVPEWSKGADCKSAGSTFGGSNPPPSTKRNNWCWQGIIILAADKPSQTGGFEPLEVQQNCLEQF
jgi:hypothetical protein